MHHGEIFDQDGGKEIPRYHQRRICKTAMQALGTMKESVKLSLERSLWYVTGRQCRNGGFCFYRTEYLEEPNLYDTYYAIASYRLMGKIAPERNRIVDYLRSAASYGSQSTYLYYSALGMHLLGRTGRDPEMRRRISKLRVPPIRSDDHRSISSWLKEILMIVKLKKTFEEVAESEMVQRVIQDLRSGRYPDYRPNLLDGYLMLRILVEIDCLREADDLVRFTDGLQVPSLGFKVTDASASINIDVLYAGVFSCATLGIPVRQAQDILGHILGSQTQDGGFARAPGAAGDLQSNYKGLRIVRYLLDQACRP